MKTEYEQHYHRAEEIHWWFVERRHVVGALAIAAHPDRKGSILEIGCAGGMLIQQLNAAGYRAESEKLPDVVICNLRKRLRPEGLLIHTKLALARGASPTDVIETLQIATAQGLEGVTMGVEILVEELRAAGQDTGFLTAPLSAEQLALKDSWQARFGDWPDFAEQLLRLHPSYFAAMLELLAAPEATGPAGRAPGAGCLELSPFRRKVAAARDGRHDHCAPGLMHVKRVRGLAFYSPPLAPRPSRSARAGPS